MKGFLQGAISSATFKQTLLTSSATVINGILGALFYILSARFLGPYNFGLLFVTLSFLTMIADISDFGINTSIVKFIARDIEKQKDWALRYLKLALELKLITWALVLVIGYVIAPVVAEQIFKKSELIDSLRLSLIGVGGALLLTYITSALQSIQKFLQWSIINISSNLIRLLIIVLLLFYQRLNINSVLVTYITIPFLGFFVGMLILPSKQILSVKNEFGLFNQFFRYSRWVGVFTLIAAVSSRLDTFLSASLLTADRVGIYGAATQLVTVFPQLISALGIVVAPKFSSFTNHKELLVYFKKLQLLVLFIALLGLIAIPLSFIFIPLIFGQSFTDAVIPFNLLLIAMLIFLASVPIHNAIIFYFGRPEVFVWVSLIHLAIIGGLGYVLINNYGIIGSATTVLIGMIFNLVMPLLWFLKAMKNEKK